MTAPPLAHPRAPVLPAPSRCGAFVLVGLVLLAARGGALPGRSAGSPAGTGLRQVGEAAEDEVRRELRVRDWAFDPAANAAALRAALCSPRWSERAWALDALARDLASGGVVTDLHREVLRAGLDDEHPSVRARAIELAAAGAPELRLEGADVERARADVLPAVRIALAGAAGGGPGALATLGALLRDGDARVRDAAVEALAAWRPDIGPTDAASEGAGPAFPWAELAPDERARVLGGWARVGDPAAAPWLLRFAEQLPGASAATERGDRAAVDRAAVAALRLVLAPGAAADADALRAGLALAPRLQPIHWELLTRAARSWSPTLRALLLEALVAGSVAASDGLGATGANPGDDAGAPAAWAGPARDLARVLAESGPPAETLALVLEADVDTWPLAAREGAVDALGARVRRWDDPRLRAAVRRALSPDRPRVLKVPLLEALALALGERGDDAAAALLAACVEDPDPIVAARAFQSLADAPGGPREGDALARAWRGLGEDERVHRLARASRARAIPALRDDLLDWAARPGVRRAAALELLAAFEGDEGVFTALASWLEEELDLLGSRAGPAPVVASAPGRLAQLARALARVDARSAVEPLQRLLAATHDAEGLADVAKVAVAELGRSDRGRSRLGAWLDEDVGRRARVEAALVLLGAHGAGTEDALAAAAVARLVADYDALAWDLARRVVAAFGELQDGRSLGWLVALARAGEEKERAAALEALAARPEVRATDTLEQAARSESGLELRHLALRLLGERGAVAALERVGAALAASEERLPPDYLAGLLRDRRFATLVAGRVEEELLATWLDGAEEDTRRFLSERLRGERVHAADFRWRVELAVGKELARRGHLRAALARAGAWWLLDARLLDALAAIAAEAGTEPALDFELARATALALAGERDVPAVERTRVLARSLALAWGDARWRTCARLARALRREHRAYRVSPRALEAAFGAPSRARGVDPAARLASTELQARAYAALEAGEWAAAEALGARAGRATAWSLAAGAAQRELEAALAAARR